MTRIIYCIMMMLVMILKVAHAAPSNYTPVVTRAQATARPAITVGARQGVLKEVLTHVYEEAHNGHNTAIFILNNKQHDYVLYADIAQELRNRGMKVEWNDKPGSYYGHHYDYSFTVTNIM